MKFKYFRNYCILLLSAILLLSGCFKKSITPDENVSWQEEIRFAQECGMDGLPCCPDSDPPCFYGQICCTDPNNPKRNKCADECACGGLEEFCCADEPKCELGLTCYQGDCVKCGDKEQPCCAGDYKCSHDLICHQGKCLECGIAGNPCCSGGLTCLNQEKMDDSRIECRNGICALCGFDGQRACFKEPKCIAGYLFNNGLCYRCGGFNQPCCDEQSGTGYKCNSELRLECVLGFCSRAGD